MEPSSRSVWLIPGALIVAGLILGIAVFAIRVNTVAIPEGGKPAAITPVSPEDHIIGNPEAKVIIVEYSDLDSEYSASYHAVLQQVMTDYAASGNVAWVYRHFPLTTEYPFSLKHAVAAECAASLGTPDTFWRFIDLMNAAAPGPVQFNPRDYPSLLTQLGVDAGQFNTCLTASTYANRVRMHAHNALAMGAEGSPFTAILVKGQDEPVVINGALTYEAMKQVIEDALAKAN